MKHLIFAVLFTLSLVTLGCGGGGGDGTPATHVAEEAILSANFAAMGAAMKDEGATATVRIETVMGYVSPDFTDPDGTPGFNSLKSTTLSRLQRYKMNEYKTTIYSSSKLDETHIDTSVTLEVNVTKRAGAVGNASGTYTQPFQTIQWVYSNGNWLILKGLPY